MAAFVLALTALGTQAATITKTNSTDGFADDSILSRTVTFAENVDFAAGSAVQDVNVAVTFEKIDGTCPVQAGGNAYNSEIFMVLESPSGTQVALIEDALNSAGSGTGATYTGISYGGLAAVTFDDWAAVAVGGLTPASGTFKPVEPLGAFQGETPLGTWILHVGDSVPGDPLCFYEYTLTIDAAQPPVVNNQTFSVAEQSANGTNVGTVVAADQDPGDKLTYTIVSGDSAGTFAINKLTGQITVAIGSQLDYETTPSYDLDVRVTDSSGLSDTATITINVTNANEAPTNIALDDSTVLEHQPVGTAVGNFDTTDPDTGDSHTYSLVSGAGDTDNGLFAIDGEQLKTNVIFNYEVRSTYSIRVQTNDGNGGTFAKQFTITIEDGNDPPGDIALSSSSVAENEAVGTAVGTFSSTDNPGNTHTYTLVDGAGADDNASFQIVDNELQTDAEFDYETGNSYSIRVRSTDDGGLWYEEVFTITVTDANDAPTGISLSSSSVAENQDAGTAVGTFSSTDQDTADSHTYSLVAGAGAGDNSSFQIVGNELQTDASFDYETDSSYSIRVRSTDNGTGGLWVEEVFTIIITDGNDAPTNITLDGLSVSETAAIGASVGQFATTDADSGDTHTYSLVSGAGDTGNASFSMSGDQLLTAVTFDFETQSSYSIRVQTDDGNGGTFVKQFTITILDGNDPPTDINLDNASVAENQMAGTAVGNFSTTDPNDNSPYTYSLVDTAAYPENDSFQISGNQLQTKASLDREVDNSYSIRVRSTDNDGLWYEEVFTITVTDANDAPTDISLSSSSVAENEAVGTAVGTFSSTDQDTGDSHTYVLTDTVNYPDNGSFTIGGVDSDQLQTAVSFDRETKSSYSIRVQTSDGGGGKFVKTLTITVTNVNEAPTDIALSSSSVNENRPPGTAVGNLSSTDPDSGDSFTYSLVTGSGDTGNGSFQIVGSQLQTAVTFDHETKDTYSIRVETRDSGGFTVQKALTITINDVNDVPIGVDDSKTVDEDHVLNVSAPGVLGNDTDQDGDSLVVMGASSTSAQGASVHVAVDGGFAYNPTAVAALQALNVGEDIEDIFTYMVRDGGLIFDTATVTVTVTGVNDVPVAHNDAVTTVLETAVIVSPLANDTDPDANDTKSLTSFGQGTHGAVTASGNGVLTYTPAAGYIGSDSFTYTMEDSHGAGDTATVNVTINPKTYYVYLPVTLNNFMYAPDLVITSLKASSEYVEIVIENQGNQTTTSGFWVDFYVNPLPPPAAANELWPELSAEGIAWGVTTSIAPGQALTLKYSTVPGAPNLYYSAADSYFTGSLPVGTPIYGQVDSAHVGHPDGAIVEDHEMTGGVYNNIFQGAATAVLPTNAAANPARISAPAVLLPARQ